MKHRYDIPVDIYEKKLSDLVPTLAGEEECEPGHSFGPYIRDYFLLHYCVSGKGTLFVGGKSYPVSQGEIFVISPNQLTVYTADTENPWHYIWIGFYGKEAERVRSLPPVVEYGAETFLKISEFVRLGVSNCEIYMSLIYEILYHLFSDKEKDTDVCKKVKDYIRLNYMQELSVESISQKFGLNRRYLSRIFKAKYGVAIKEYTVTMRCHKAAEFLKNGYNVAEAAMMVGYPDQFAFSKIFRKVFGQPPGTYKNK